MEMASTITLAPIPGSTPDSPLDHSEMGLPSHSTLTVVSVDSGPTGLNREFEEEAYGPTATGEKGDPYEVRWTENDPSNPKNWSRLFRWYLTMAATIFVTNGVFASSAPEGIAEQLEEHFTFSDEVLSLLISLFVAGFCVGPLIWGPASEAFGRRPVFLLAFLGYTGFQAGCALSRNTASILVFRFLSGAFAAAPLSNSGAVMADIWDVDTRGIACAFFALGPFAGPALGPVVAGYMNVAGLSWRWVFWVLTMFAGACFIAIYFTIPETYTPILLVQRAEQLRKETGDNRWWAPMERSPLSWGQRTRHILGRPFAVLFQEPMLIAITIYMSFIYGCLYLLFESYPIVFGEGHHFNSGASGLMFVPIFIGAAGGVFLYIIIFDKRYKRWMTVYAPHPVPPEYRLEMTAWTSPLLAISFFWFGWTSYPSISYWAPMLSGVALGLSVVGIFLSLINYTVDTYLFVSASALAAQTVVRSLFGAGFPLFATQMFDELDPRWASSVLGFIAIVLAPIPFILRKYGPVLRRRSKFAPTTHHEKQITTKKLSSEETV